jgi:hypothetical protein
MRRNFGAEIQDAGSASQWPKSSLREKTERFTLPLVEVRERSLRLRAQTSPPWLCAPSRPRGNGRPCPWITNELTRFELTRFDPKRLPDCSEKRPEPRKSGLGVGGNVAIRPDRLEPRPPRLFPCQHPQPGRPDRQGLPGSRHRHEQRPYPDRLDPVREQGRSDPANSQGDGHDPQPARPDSGNNREQVLGRSD